MTVWERLTNICQVMYFSNIVLPVHHLVSCHNKVHELFLYGLVSPFTLCNLHFPMISFYMISDYRFHITKCNDEKNAACNRGFWEPTFFSLLVQFNHWSASFNSAVNEIPLLPCVTLTARMISVLLYASSNEMAGREFAWQSAQYWTCWRGTMQLSISQWIATPAQHARFRPLSVPLIKPGDKESGSEWLIRPASSSSGISVAQLFINRA